MKQENLSGRKKRHLDICLNPDLALTAEVNWFDHIHLLPSSLPELDWKEIDTSASFLNKKISLPFYINSMTGGEKKGNRMNRQLAECAAAWNIPLGSGSIRIVLENPEIQKNFDLKPILGSSPYFLNIGAQQLRNQSIWVKLFKLEEQLRADGLAIHLNPSQELFQTEGQRDFRNILDTIRTFREQSPIPVIVKETGTGISPSEIDLLQQRGVDFIDVSGSGGTNWVLVEGEREENPCRDLFKDWGHPTPFILDCVKEKKAALYASGGIRHAMDCAKALALGADAGGFARAALVELNKGPDYLHRWMEQQAGQFRKILLLTGNHSPEELKKTALRFSSHWELERASYGRAYE